MVLHELFSYCNNACNPKRVRQLHIQLVLFDFCPPPKKRQFGDYIILYLKICSEYTDQNSVLSILYQFFVTYYEPLQLCMQEIGPNVQGASISLHLANILKNNWRLPAPPNCPPMVSSRLSYGKITFAHGYSRH